MQEKLIVVIDNLEKASNLYVSSLEVYLNVNIVKFDTFSSAQQFLNKQTADIVISRAQIENVNVDKLVHKYIENNKLRTTLYVLGQTKLDIHSAKILKENFEISTLIKSVAQDLEITPAFMAKLDVGEYYPFKIDNIVTNLNLICDLYIKSDNQYIRFISKDSYFTKDVVNILENQNNELIYVKSSERLKFINSQLIYFQELLTEDQLSLSDEVFITNNAYKLIKKSIYQMNVSAEVIMTTEKCINTIQSIISKVPTLDKLFDVLKESKDINFNQTILLCFICNHVIDNIDWGNYEQKVKLTFVSFFHNITLSPELSLINDNDRLKMANLSKDQKNEVLNHALEAAKIVSGFKTKIPFGVDTIIKQHHGARDGIGFNSFPQSISPLALIFLVADEWVTQILRAQIDNRRVSKSDLLGIVKYKYRTLSFETVIKAFDKIDI